MSASEDIEMVEDLKGSVEGILAPTTDNDAGLTPLEGNADAAGSVRGKIGREVVMRVPVTVQVVLGKLRMPVAELMQLSQGSVVALDRSLGEPVDLLVNGHLIARGEIVVVENTSKRFGISLTEIVENSAVV